MANTLIQIKRSTETSVPTALNVAEPAYSYSSNVLWLGTSDSTGVIPIGGQYYVAVANLSLGVAQAAFAQANIGGSGGVIASAAYDKANAANVLAFNTGIGANAFASATIAGANTAVGTGANAFASATIAGANTAVGTGANTYLLATIAGANTAVGAGANAYMIAVQNGSNTAVGTAANNFASATIAGANTAVGTGANAFTSATIAGANTAVGTGANTVGIAAFAAENITRAIAVAAYINANSKFSSSGGTITGDVSIVGNLTLSGNTSYINVETYIVNDPLIYLAGNNYTSDIVDIGFVANYMNATGSNVHTGIYRDSTTKEYYVFQGYDQEPVNNHINPTGNNFALAVLNTDIRTSNLNLAGTNTILWITAAYSQANNTGPGTNTYLLSVIAGANTTVGTGANAFTSATIAGANTAVGTGANLFTSATIAGANTAVGTGANTYLLTVIAGANTAVGAGANSVAIAAFIRANNAANASNITSGVLPVQYGGTGLTTIANNGVLFGNVTSSIRSVASSTEGHVLQVSNQGTPIFAMLDGGVF